MTKAKELQEKAEMFERRAENATDPISKHHYKEMAAHYRSLAVEHLKSSATNRRTSQRKTLFDAIFLNANRIPTGTHFA